MNPPVMHLIFYAFGAAVVSALVGLIMGRVARSRGQLWAFQLLTLYAALFFSAAAVYLFTMGSRARWTSDGPGMLVVMLVLAASGVVALVCWAAFLARLGRRFDEP